MRPDESDDGLQDIEAKNHASNYLLLEGILSRDKRKLVEVIDMALKGKIHLKPEFFICL